MSLITFLCVKGSIAIGIDHVLLACSMYIHTYLLHCYSKTQWESYMRLTTYVFVCACFSIH